LCQIILFAIKNENFEGIYNAVSPNAVSYKELIHAIALKLKRPILLPPIPAAILRIALGEMSRMITGSLIVSPEKIEKAGFRYSFPTMKNALDAIY
jgi:NAD dependent epimerase/dehydratase family enzyme